MVNHKIDGVRAAFNFLRDCICASSEWAKDDITMEVTATNHKTVESRSLHWSSPSKES